MSPNLPTSLFAYGLYCSVQLVIWFHNICMGPSMVGALTTCTISFVEHARGPALTHDKGIIGKPNEEMDKDTVTCMMIWCVDGIGRHEHNMRIQYNGIYSHYQSTYSPMNEFTKPVQISNWQYIWCFLGRNGVRRKRVGVRLTQTTEWWMDLQLAVFLTNRLIVDKVPFQRSNYCMEF